MSPISFVHAYQPHKVFFPGIAEVDDANGEKIIRPTGSGTYHVVSMEIIGTSGVKPGVTGTTTVTASLTSLGAGISASITQAQRKSPARVDAPGGGLEFTAGSPIYVRRSAAGGGHSDIEVNIYVKQA